MVGKDNCDAEYGKFAIKIALTPTFNVSAALKGWKRSLPVPA
jgi:hypothetical protein